MAGLHYSVAQIRHRRWLMRRALPFAVLTAVAITTVAGAGTHAGGYISPWDGVPDFQVVVNTGPPNPPTTKDVTSMVQPPVQPVKTTLDSAWNGFAMNPPGSFNGKFCSVVLDKLRALTLAGVQPLVVGDNGWVLEDPSHRGPTRNYNACSPVLGPANTVLKVLPISDQPAAQFFGLKYDVIDNYVPPGHLLSIQLDSQWTCRLLTGGQWELNGVRQSSGPPSTPPDTAWPPAGWRVTHGNDFCGLIPRPLNLNFDVNLDLSVSLRSLTTIDGADTFPDAPLLALSSTLNLQHSVLTMNDSAGYSALKALNDTIKQFANVDLIASANGYIDNVKTDVTSTVQSGLEDVNSKLKGGANGVASFLTCGRMDCQGQPLSYPTSMGLFLAVDSAPHGSLQGTLVVQYILDLFPHFTSITPMIGSTIRSQIEVKASGFPRNDPAKLKVFGLPNVNVQVGSLSGFSTAGDGTFDVFVDLPPGLACHSDLLVRGTSDHLKPIKVAGISTPSNGCIG